MTDFFNYYSGAPQRVAVREPSSNLQTHGEGDRLSNISQKDSTIEGPHVHGREQLRVFMLGIGGVLFLRGYTTEAFTLFLGAILLWK